MYTLVLEYALVRRTCRNGNLLAIWCPWAQDVLYEKHVFCSSSTAFGRPMPSYGGAMMIMQGGDVCDETGLMRTLKSSVTCCATNQIEANGEATSPLAILVSIQV